LALAESRSEARRVFGTSCSASASNSLAKALSYPAMDFPSSARRDAGEIGASRRRSKGERETQDVVRGMADDALVEIANLDRYFSIDAGDGPRLPTWQSPQNPYRRSDGRSPAGSGRASDKLLCGAPDEAMRGFGHFQPPEIFQPDRRPRAGRTSKI